MLRPEEVELACRRAVEVRANFVGLGEIEEVLFAGAVERLRVRMPQRRAGGGGAGPRSGLAAGRIAARGVADAAGAARIPGVPSASGSPSVRGASTCCLRRFRASRRGRHRRHGSRVCCEFAAAVHAREPHAHASLGRLRRGLADRTNGGTCAGAARHAGDRDRVGQRRRCRVAAAPRRRAAAVRAADGDAADGTWSSTRSDAGARRAMVPVAASLLRHVPRKPSTSGSTRQRPREGAGRVHARACSTARSAGARQHGLDMRTELASVRPPTSWAASSRRTRTRCSCSARREPRTSTGPGSARCSRASPSGPC